MSTFKRLIAPLAVLGMMIAVALPASADHGRDRDRDRYDDHQAYWQRRDMEQERDTYRRFVDRQRYWNQRDSRNERWSYDHHSGRHAEDCD